jgi:hypothetical protein
MLANFSGVAMRATGLGLIFMTIASSAALPALAVGSDPAAFDGSWDVIAFCPSTASGTFGYTLQFAAQVKSGLLHGVYGTEGKPASLVLDGPIQPDGSAKLAAKGLTGDSDYTQGKVKPATPYGYDVTATFKGSRGTGTWVGGTRICNYSFQRR